MNAAAPVSYSKDGDGVGWLLFGDPDGRARVLGSAAQAALAQALTAAENDGTLRALILIAGGGRVFLAGADLREIAALPDAATASEFSRRGQRLLQRLANLPVPVIAAIDGACVGGGFELALACHWRIATDAAATRVGLPETAIGVIPGWGGCVRLPRLVGVAAALDHILTAELLGADAARGAGFIDEVVPVAELRSTAKVAALTLAKEGRPEALRPPAPDPNVFPERRRAVEKKTRGHLPALSAAIDVLEQSWQNPQREALEIEARVFGEIAAGRVCKNLVRVFFLREAARKRTLDGWFAGTSAEPIVRSEATSADEPGKALASPPIRRVGVVGAGVMGSGITQWLAAHGFDVVWRDVQRDILDAGMDVVRRLFDQAVKRGRMNAGEANAGVHRIDVTTGWDGFDACDLVIEAIVEDRDAKRALFSELAAIVPPRTILASNSSALPIEEIAASVPNPERTLGIHFFNPVSRMTLVELILGKHTSHHDAGRALAFTQALGKSPVPCRSSPGFLVTRVLFFYLNAAVRLWEEGRSTEEIDAAMRDFGWPMGPLRLIDEVGVDVTDAIFRELEHYFSGRFHRTTLCARMLAAGRRGRKNGTSGGFYRYENGRELPDETLASQLHPSDETTDGRSPRETSDLASDLMRVMADEAQRCLDERVVATADDVDFALISGAGFPAFRGGLLHWAASTLQSGSRKP